MVPAFKCEPGDKVSVGDILAYMSTFRQGIDGTDGMPGIQGPVGKAGHGVIIRGVDSLSHIYVRHARSGDLYICSDAGIYDGHGFVSDGKGAGQQHWTHIGRIRGNDGPVGPIGLPSKIAGPQGPIGINGIQGSQGIAGPQGHIGLEGPQGVDGLQGVHGVEGPEGIQGPKGLTGTGIHVIGIKDTSATIFLITNPNIGDAWIAKDTGDIWIFDSIYQPHDPAHADWHDVGHVVGPEGPIGITGKPGPTGPHGSVGVEGPTGIQGPQGLAGHIGHDGPVGPAGTQGIQGIQGSHGIDGIDGKDGSGVTIVGSAPTLDIIGKNFSIAGQMWIAEDIGVDSQGDAVNIGDGIVSTGTEWIVVGPIRGPIGQRGDMGIQGVQGITGVTGATGPAGADGLRGIQGTIGATGSQGSEGPMGAQGIQGLMGNSLEFLSSYDTVTNLIAGEVNPTNYDTHLVLDTGDLWTYNDTIGGGTHYWHNIGHVQGPEGPKGANGAPGIQGPPGIDGIVGVDGIQGIQGIRGIRGIPGPYGPRGFPGISGPQGHPGKQGIQGIKGNKGDIGNTGNTGADGAQGIDGVDGATGAQGPAGPVLIATVNEVKNSLNKTKAVTPFTLNRKVLVESIPVGATEHKIPNMVYMTEADYKLITPVAETLYVLTEN